MVSLIQEEIIAQSTTHSLPAVRQFVSECLEKAQVSSNESRLIILAVDEAVSSIICNSPSESQIRIKVDIDSNRFLVLINDSSQNFYLGPLPLMTLNELIERHRHMEIGIFLIRKIMDEVNYVYKRGCENQLEMIKYFSAAKSSL